MQIHRRLQSSVTVTNKSKSADESGATLGFVLSETSIPLEEVVDIDRWDLIALPEREGCQVGYQGTLCAVCADGYYAAK